MKKQSLRNVGRFWGVQDDESKWMNEAINPPPPKESVEQKFVRHKDLQHVLKTIILALHREILPPPFAKPFQFPTSKITNGGSVPKKYYPDAVWELEKKYFTDELQQQAEREYRKQLHESTANATFATPDATRYCFDRHERLSGGRISKAVVTGKGRGRVNHSEPWRAPNFDPDQVNCRTRNAKKTSTKPHYTWAHAEKRAVQNKFKRCEHLLEVMNRERRLDVEREVKLLRPDLTNHDKAEIAKERAKAADKIMDILLEYKMISITENAEYLMHTLQEYKLEQEDIARGDTASSRSVGGGRSVKSAGTLAVQSEVPSFDDTSLGAASDKLDFELKALYSAKYPRKYANANITGNKKQFRRKKPRRKQVKTKKPKPMFNIIKESDGSDRGVIRRAMPTSTSYAAEKILLDLDRRGLHTLPLPPEHRQAGHIGQRKPYSMHFERHFDPWDGYLGQEDPRDEFGLVKSGFRTKLSDPDAKNAASGSTKAGGAKFHLEQVYRSPHRSGYTGRPRPYHLKVSELVRIVLSKIHVVTHCYCALFWLAGKASRPNWRAGGKESSRKDQRICVDLSRLFSQVLCNYLLHFLRSLFALLSFNYIQYMTVQVTTERRSDSTLGESA